MYTLKNADIGQGYDDGIKSDKYKNDYEFNRWFIRPRNRAEYAMTYVAISHHIKNISFRSCLELGPGPGTWTRLLFRTNRQASFDLVDISKEMKTQFELEMRGGEKVRYFVADIMQHNADLKYDLFFSSRAVEYLDDKPAFFKKLASLITAQGQGVIVTKNPYHGVRKSKKPAHQGQISMPDMLRLLSAHGFTDVQFYPVVIRIPIISRFMSELSEYIFHRRLYREINIDATNRIVESYMVTFAKE